MLETCFWLRDFENLDWFTENMRWMREADVDTADLDLSCAPTLELLASDRLDSYVTAARAAADACGMHFYMGHAPFHPRMSADEEQNSRMVDLIRRSIPVAGRMGVKNLVIHPVFAGFTDPLYGQDETLLRMNIDFYTEMVALAKPYGITVCTENMFTTDPEHHVRYCFTSRPADLMRIMDAVPGLCVCLDNGHFHLLGEDMVQPVYTYGSRLRTVHLHSNGGRQDNHVGPFELDRLPWEAFCKALKETGYQGAMNLESSNVFDNAPRGMYPACFRYLQASSRYLAEMVEKA